MTTASDAVRARRSACLLGCLSLLAGVLWPLEAALAQTCTEAPYDFAESFDTTSYMDPSSSVARWGSGEIVPRTKGNSFSGKGFSTGYPVYLVASGDWDHDGWMDMVGFFTKRLSVDGPGVASHWSTAGNLHYMKNRQIGGSPSAHLGFDAGDTVAAFNAYTLDWTIPCSVPVGDAPLLVSGDFDGDGDTDLFYARNQNQGTDGNLLDAYIYEFTGLNGSGVPQFTRIDVKSQLLAPTGSPPTTPRISWHWTGTVAQVVDWNGDHKDDIVFGTSYGTTQKVLLFTGKSGPIGFNPAQTLINNAGLTTPFADSGQAYNCTSTCRPGGSSCRSRGITTVMVGDFDNNGARDIIVGSVSENRLKRWNNDGSGVLTAGPNISFADGGVSVGLPADYDGDGDLDFVIARDGKNCGPAKGTVWFFANNGPEPPAPTVPYSFTMRSTPISDCATYATGCNDLDFGVAFNVDNDVDQTTDIIVADGNDSGTYTEILNVRLDIYNTQGVATSLVVDSLDNAVNSIVKVKITAIDADVPSGTGITYYVSNDGGQYWEEVTTDQLPPPTGTSAFHEFTHHGSELRWRAVLTAEDTSATFPVDEQQYSPGTKDPPVLREIAFDYYSVERRRYTRSGLAYGQFGSGTDRHEMMFAASYWFPGYEATVTAYELQELEAGTATGLERVDSHDDVTLAWDAGTLLSTTPESSRTVYYAMTGSSTAWPFTVDAVTADPPATSPSLQDLMVIDDATRAEVVRFVRGRKGDDSADRSWKFYDVGHSTPVFLGAPTGDSAYLGASYETFKTGHADREPTVLIGANDGLLHAFDASTGQERWAIIPENLLAKAKTQRITNAAGDEAYDHKFFIDGKVAIQDVEAAGVWSTIAVVGQARGDGRGNNNYYFAIDVTDPTLPKPLWEFSDPLDESTPTKPSTGETWSTPAIGRVSIGGVPTYVVFVGSGYNNRGAGYFAVGRALYALNALTGEVLGRWDVDDIPNGAQNPSTIENTLPGGAALADIDGNGLVDRVYFGDLEGRIWRLDTSVSATFSTDDPPLISNWPAANIFDAGLPTGSGDRTWAPIVTRPAVAVLGGKACVYFGTGGDDAAPDSLTYRFYAVCDDGGLTTRYPNNLVAGNLEWYASGETGYKFWSDPVIVNNSVVYFASLPGTIESVNPCTSAVGESHLYGYAIRAFTDGSQIAHAAGEAVIGSPPLATASKVREAVLLRGPTVATWARPVTVGDVGKNDILLQTFTGSSAAEQPPIQRVTEGGVTAATTRRVVIVKWREIRL